MSAETHPSSSPAPRPQGRRRRRRAAILAGSVVGHGLVLSVFFWAPTDAPRLVEDAPVVVSLVDGSPRDPAPTPKPKPVVATPPAAFKAARPTKLVRHMNPRPDPDALPYGEPEVAEAGPQLSDAQIAGAASADGGPSGGPCDMARWLQTALRKDALVQAAVRHQPGKAIMVWNGDWVRNSGEDGRGLAAVREAILWQIAFAPAACKTQTVHGLILMSMNGEDAPKLAVGSGDWRWSDLLKVRPTYVER